MKHTSMHVAHARTSGPRASARQPLEHDHPAPQPSSSLRSSSILTTIAALAFLGCVGQPPDEALHISIRGATITGSFDHGGSIIAFDSELLDAERATLQLAVDDVVIDVALDRVAQTIVEDGHFGALDDAQLAALLALRDALELAHPELVDTLHGSLLLRETDRYAEAPVGLTLDRHETGYGGAPIQDRADGCGDDGVSCLPGTSGASWAVYDPGSSGTCVWQAASYGSGGCSGRCGAGCNFLDNDYTWDCLDHDRCIDAYGGSVLSGNPNCGDEFWDASDDYAATVAPLCFGGSTRSGPPAAVCGDGVVAGSEACDDGNSVDGDGCSASCAVEETCSDCPTPELLASGDPSGLELDDTHVYWLDFDGHQIVRVGKDGGAVEIVVADVYPGEYFVNELALDATHVYWTSNDQIMRRSKAGGAIETVATNLESPANLRVDDSDAYWIEHDSDRRGAFLTGALRRCPSAGGAIATIVASDAWDLALDETHVYWLPESGGIERRRKTGGARETVLEGNLADTIVIDDRDIYWTDSNTGRLGRIAKDGSSDNQAFAEGEEAGLELAVDADNVYWNVGPGTIKYRAKTSGPVDRIVTGQSAIEEIRVDATHLYWLNDSGEISRVAKPGS